VHLRYSVGPSVLFYAMHMPSLPAVLTGVRVLSVALNVPGPAALVRLRQMGATCTQIVPPSGDPMAQYSPRGHAELSAGLTVQGLDLKQPADQERLQAALAQTDVLITSFRPAALRKLGLDAGTLGPRYPRLSTVAILGALPPGAEAPGHDLTYQAEVGLVPGLGLPPTLLADMAGALQACEAVLQAVLAQRATGAGLHLQVGLAEAAQWMAWPLVWGLTAPGGLLGGQHAGYRVYPCQDGRVALAALEPHFVAALGRVLGDEGLTPEACLQPATHAAVAAWMARHTRQQLEALSEAHDLPLHTLPEPLTPG
jgi:alpha-methylacyl-CoA racemase